ncbi:bifunctional riboflavin kinase/FAD synthetase [Neisseria wadsworthii]|uniref:Riboflavin biosynthesis protein n=1 Tax=Neisseria wadsworthii 9715 TaxID=1030841 RepID=G4CP87_9NEIS|nr:bifunctional riboflavin kinase/FAD synthetase [Neisseria wadsworthii]EGZ48371.1 riboflavin biosynthesis protein RibF [Neisseria wadsworthii 9715]QMT34719.1 bifunctional riboflavin kinase/FAD synthetase [Neisseria wadsworthii]
MEIWFGLNRKPVFAQGVAATIGNFDGVHLGHLHILRRLKEEAQKRGLPAVAIVFEPQPSEFFARKFNKPLPFRLSPLRDKLKLLEATGCLDAVWVLRFNQSFADIPAQTFIDRLLRQSLDTRYLLVGDDFRFGAGREGDFAMLQNQQGMFTERTPSVLIENMRVSSTAVRQALAGGLLDCASSLLGHDYVLSGRVKHGAKLGRTIGSPTANIHLPNHHYALSGVFVVEAEGSFGRKRGVASFGVNPTVSQTSRQKLEVHLFDFDGNIYGERLHVHFLHKLRNEEKFPDIESMMVQIRADMAEARGWQPMPV